MRHLFHALLTAGALMISAPTWSAPPDEIDDLTQHLEFMGYDVSVNSERMAAKHASQPNILLKKFRSGVLVTSFYSGTPYGKSHKEQFLNVVNSLNSDSVAARYYVDADGDMVLEAYYPGSYNKKAFSAFIDNYNQSSKQLSNKFNELKEFLK